MNMRPVAGEDRIDLGAQQVERGAVAGAAQRRGAPVGGRLAVGAGDEVGDDVGPFGRRPVAEAKAGVEGLGRRGRAGRYGGLELHPRPKPSCGRGRCLCWAGGRPARGDHRIRARRPRLSRAADRGDARADRGQRRDLQPRAPGRGGPRPPEARDAEQRRPAVGARRPRPGGDRHAQRHPPPAGDGGDRPRPAGGGGQAAGGDGRPRRAARARAPTAPACCSRCSRTAAGTPTTSRSGACSTAATWATSSATSRASSAGARRPSRAPGARRCPASQGGGLLLDLGSHLVDQALPCSAPSPTSTPRSTPAAGCPPTTTCSSRCAMPRARSATCAPPR